MASGNRAVIVQHRSEGITCLEKEAFVNAECHLRTALEMTAEQKNAETLMLMQRLAESLIGQNKFVEAESLAKNAISGFRKYGPDDEDMLDSQCLLAECLQGQRKYSDAGDTAKSALNILESNMKRGPEHIVTLKCRGVLALALKGQCKFQDAVALARFNLECLETTRIKAETNASVGSRRLSQPERQAFARIETISRKVIGEDSQKPKSPEDCQKPKRNATIESSVSTTTPDSDNEQSSQISSQQNSRMPSKENTVA